MAEQNSRRKFMQNGVVLGSGALLLAHSLALPQAALAAAKKNGASELRLAMAEISQMDASQLAVYEMVPTNLTRSMMIGGSIGRDLAKYSLYFNNSVVDPVTRVLTLIRTAVRTNCDYVTRLYVYHARKILELDDKVVRGALATGTNEALTPKQQVLMTYIDQSIENGRASDEAYFAFKDQFNDQEVASITLLMGYGWQMASYAVNMNVPLDEHLRSVQI
jgi:alkylhydroperoxidase family enzyme